ncbi:DoxX family protein [Nonomuraea sp. KC401]|uniref:DoxX family protein n=1 Tax=unclassified Nonomuraea TaxID=2593643 RepID=UPI0010FCF568|nr:MULTISPECIES: DoxX family protein [unclassified Nonomuraea]NBE96374.1 DoxX family membrane protein [Nonomuraea sp. K271]TLF68085.1 DoxX family protein [Nonomuraea sp. KC401]
MKRILFDVAALVARVVTGVIFLAHGWQKWQGGLGATAQGFRESGIPAPEVAAAYATVVETVGGIFLILGLLVRPVVVLLLLNMLGAIFFVHWGLTPLSADNGWEVPGALGSLSLLFLVLGGGRFGLDGIFRAMSRRRAERRAAEADLAAHAPAGRGGPTTPLPAQEEPPQVPRQPSAPKDSGLSDKDMRDIDALVGDEQPPRREPPKG